MRKILFFLVVCSGMAGSALSQNWDQHMIPRLLNIRIQANAFAASTFLEMEFYNPTEKEMEGLYRFSLEPGQVITAFQLDLNGKYRDGSIEERWKAMNAYNTIVGKRVDPALLQMEGVNQYSLRIYPVPAKGSRKVTMTIEQVMPFLENRAVYTLPVHIKDSVQEINTSIVICQSAQVPKNEIAWLAPASFASNGSTHTLTAKAIDVPLMTPLRFSIPVDPLQAQAIIRQVDGKNHIAFRLGLDTLKAYPDTPRKLSIYWDVSASGRDRDTDKEISFIKAYLSAMRPAQVRVVMFNQRLRDTLDLGSDGSSISKLEKHLRALRYEGGTRYGLLDLSAGSPDVVLIFTDGQNSVGTRMPVAANGYVYCVTSTPGANKTGCRQLIGFSGGMIVDLLSLNLDAALQEVRKSSWLPVSITTDAGAVILDRDLRFSENAGRVISGTVPQGATRLTVSYGNARDMKRVTEIPLQVCGDDSPLARLSLLYKADSLFRNCYWQDMIALGKREKIVTPQTSFIVLEKIEDYIKYMITPPRELEGACDMQLFVNADAARKKEWNNLAELTELSAATAAYNKRLSWWDQRATPVSLKQDVEENKKIPVPGAGTATPVASKPMANTIVEPGAPGAVMGTEVVVTAMGITRQPKELGYAITKIKSYELNQAQIVNLQSGLTGKVSGLQVQTVNNGVFADTRITIRGIRSLTGNNQPLWVVDGLPLAQELISRINPKDVLSVEIIKGAAGAAIYGPDGVNGVVLITTRKGTRGGYTGRPLRYKDCEDVDYVQEMRSLVRKDKFYKYEELREKHAAEPGFYIDMAEQLFQAGYLSEAMDILYSTADRSAGEKAALKAIAFTLEGWKETSQAVSLYRIILEEYEADLNDYRNLALALFQEGEWQSAADTYYKGITLGDAIGHPKNNAEIRAMMLQEMNALIDLHRSQLDISAFRRELIRPLPVDIRVTVDGNKDNAMNWLIIKEPGGSTSYSYLPAASTANGGRITEQYNDANASCVPSEYMIRNARNSKYHILVDYYAYYDYRAPLTMAPKVVRLVKFINMGRPDQKIEVKSFVMENLYGEVELDDILKR